MSKVVFFNVAWMKEYKGVTSDDIPVHGGKYIENHGYGSEVYNFQPFRGRMYGFVEAGWKPKLRCIDITKLGASKWDQSVPGILVVWVARHPHSPRTLLVGWYKNATVYRERQKPPEGSNRKLPDGEDASYFAEADEQNCYLMPADRRDFSIPRGKEGLGQKNIWYAHSRLGRKIRTEVLEYISKW